MDFRKLEGLLDSFLDLGIPGVDCMVYCHGQPVFRHMAGYADQEAKAPVTEKTLWYLYSATKVVTCTAALMLYEEGKFLLDDPLSDYMPEFSSMTVRKEDGSVKPAKRPILIGDLFSMTAGFSYRMDTPKLLEGVAATKGKAPLREMMKYLAKEPLSFEPGENWQYSLCHDVLGGLIEVLSGMSFGQFLKERIFDPLQMKDTGFFPDESQKKRLAKVYRYQKEKRTSIPCPPLPAGPGSQYESGGAGLFSSVEEYARFASALVTGKLLHPSTIRLMTGNRLDEKKLAAFRRSGEPGFEKSNERAGYGYGLGVRTMIDPIQGGSNGSLGEFGWGGLMGAYVLMDPKEQLALFYMQQTLNPPAGYTRARLRNVLYACLDRK